MGPALGKATAGGARKMTFSVLALAVIAHRSKASQSHMLMMDVGTCIRLAEKQMHWMGWSWGDLPVHLRGFYAVLPKTVLCSIRDTSIPLAMPPNIMSDRSNKQNGSRSLRREVVLSTNRPLIGRAASR